MGEQLFRIFIRLCSETNAIVFPGWDRGIAMEDKIANASFILDECALFFFRFAIES